MATQIINWILGAAGAVIGIVGLIYLNKARSKMSNVLKISMTFITISVLVFIAQSAGDLLIITNYSLPFYSGLWISATFFIGMLFLVIGFKKLAESFG